MIKKVLAYVLTFALLLSSTSVVTAAKKENIAGQGTAPKGIILWGSFEDGLSYSKARVYNNGTVKAQVPGGANKTNYCIKIDSSKSPVLSSLYVLLNKGFVPGETYDISFYAKADEEVINGARLIIRYKGGEESGQYTQTKDQPIYNEWTKLTYTWTCPKGVNGQEPDELVAIDIEVRWISVGENTNNTELWFDEFDIVPHGIKDANYDILNYGFITEDVTLLDAPESEGNVTFSDVKNHWARQVVETLATNDYINGMGDGTYSPNTQVTRAQFMKMVADLYETDAPKYDNRFNDVKAEQWYTDAIMTVDELGLVDDAMKANGKICPDQPITREEASSIAAKAAKDRGASAKNDVNTNFTDDGSISDWAKQGVKEAASYGLILGYDDGTYLPKNQITRAEAATILLRLVEIKSKMHIYVDAANGSDDNDGSDKKPLKTIEAARDLVAKKYAPTMENDIKILIRGEQKLTNTFILNESHSGKNGYKIIYTSWGGEKANITMNDKYTGFELHDSDKNIWKTYIGKGTISRQAYFNDVKGIRARSVAALKNCDRFDDDHVYGVTPGYYLCDNTELLTYAHPEEVELVYHFKWLNPRFQVRSFTEENGRVRINMHKYFSWWNPYDYEDAVTEDPTYIENAYELLDQRGEWYLSKYDGYMYYIPRFGEDMSTMVCELSTKENLIRGEGKDYDNPLAYIAFDNLILEGTTWKRPSLVGGHNDAQSNHEFDEKGYYFTPNGGAIHFEKSQHIDVTNCLIRQMGHSGIYVMDGARYVNIIGNEFSDISGTSAYIDITSGHPLERSQKTFVEYIKFNNNYIHHVARDFQSAAGISVGMARHSEFNHNEISNVPYSGFHIGYGWENYVATGQVIHDLDVSYNYIHDIMDSRIHDGGCIYTLGTSTLEAGTSATGSEGKNKMVGNYCVNLWNNYAYLYHDNSSSSWYDAYNVCDTGVVREYEGRLYGSPKQIEDFPWMSQASNSQWMTIEHNYINMDDGIASGFKSPGINSTTEPVNIIKDGNWPEEARETIKNAGIEPEYKGNFNLDTPRILAGIDKWQSIPLNTPVDSMLRILGPYNKEYDISDYDLEIWCDDPEALSIDKNGYITAHKAGEYWIEVAVTMNGHTELQFMKLECGDDPKTVSFNVDSINLIKGGVGKYDIVAKTILGNTRSITAKSEINIAPEDEGIVDLSFENGKVVVEAIGKGKTNITGTITYGDITLPFSVPIKIISYGSEEGATLPFRKIDLTDPGSWNQLSFPNDGGLAVGSKSHEPAHFQEKITNELLAFDMTIDAGNSWPSLALCSEYGKYYTTSDVYMIGFSTGGWVEFQRFNTGVRTVIFGDTLYDNPPVGGPKIPNTGDSKFFEHGKRYSVVVGALDTPEGTRIILNLNGKNIIDYIDEDSNRLPADGYFGFYNPAPGSITFYPYTGMTE